MKCPLCETGNAVVKSEKRTLTFRNEQYEVEQHFYQCDTCGEQFTTDQQDDFALGQVYGQYTNNNKIAMQARCVHCKQEQHAMRVYGVSVGIDTCAWCGKRSEPMTQQEYHEALKKTE